MPRARLFGLAAVLGGSLVACGGGGGGGSIAPPAAGPAAPALSSTAKFVLTLQQSSTSSTARRPAFLDSATQSVSIALTQVNGAAPPSAIQTVANIGPTAPGCVVTGSTTICSIGVGAVVGNDTYTITAFAQPNAAGSVLSSGTTTLPITLGASNSAAIVLTGVVSSLTLALANPYLPTGVAGTTAVTVSALDAAGNTIVGPYSGTLTLTSSDPSVTLAPASITSSSTAVAANYTGAARSAVTITAMLSGATASGAATLTPTTNIVNYPIPTASTNPFGLVQGPDGAIYFGEIGPTAIIDPLTGFVGAITQAQIGRLDPATGTITELPLGAGEYDPIGILFTPDGALWTALEESDNLVRVSPFAAAGVTVIALPVAIPSPFPTPPENAVLPRSFAYVSGTLYVTEAVKGAIRPVNVTSPYAVGTAIPLPLATNLFGGTAQHPEGITVGSDGNLWVAATFGNKVYRVVPTTGVATGFSTTLSNVEPRFIASGSDGNLYVTGLGIGGFDSNGFLERVSTAGAVTVLSLPSGSSPDTIVPGPPGTLYFVDYGNEGIGSVSTGTGAVQVWPIATRPLGDTDAANAVLSASDGSIYFSTATQGGISVSTVSSYNANEIRRLILAQGWTVYPQGSIGINGVGAANALVVGLAESGDSSPFTTTSSNNAIVTIAPMTGFSHNFLLTGIAPGTSTIKFTDRNGRSVTSTVNVTQTTGTIQSQRRKTGAGLP